MFNVGQLCPEIMTLNLDSSATQGGDTSWEIPMTLDAFETKLVFMVWLEKLPERSNNINSSVPKH